MHLGWRWHAFFAWTKYVSVCVFVIPVPRCLRPIYMYIFPLTFFRTTTLLKISIQLLFSKFNHQHNTTRLAQRTNTIHTIFNSKFRRKTRFMSWLNNYLCVLLVLFALSLRNLLQRIIELVIQLKFKQTNGIFTPTTQFINIFFLTRLLKTWHSVTPRSNQT